jgi:bacterioferritin
MKVFENIIEEEQLYYDYFDNIHGHIEKLKETYLAKIAGIPSSIGLGPNGFTAPRH